MAHVGAQEANRANAAWSRIIYAFAGLMCEVVRVKTQRMVECRETSVIGLMLMCLDGCWLQSYSNKLNFLLKHVYAFLVGNCYLDHQDGLAGLLEIRALIFRLSRFPFLYSTNRPTTALMTRAM